MNEEGRNRKPDSPAYVVGGGSAIGRDGTDAGKLSFVGGLSIAGAPVIVKALFTAFGLDGSTVDIGAFQ